MINLFIQFLTMGAIAFLILKPEFIDNLAQLEFQKYLPSFPYWPEVDPCRTMICEAALFLRSDSDQFVTRPKTNFNSVPR